MITTDGGVELYTREEAIALGEDPGEGNELIVWRDSHGDIVSTSSCIAGIIKEGEKLYSSQACQQQPGAQKKRRGERSL